MKKLTQDIYQWSVFNEEKDLNFNGLYIQTPEGAILIDPPPMSEEDVAEVESLGVPHAIYLTNKHHTRGTEEHEKRWPLDVIVPEDDVSLMEIAHDGTYTHGDFILEVLQAIHIPHAKTPGECAFYWPQKKVLIIGDAFVSKDSGLAMLPDDKFKDPNLAREGLRVLKGLDYNILLPGDGAPLLENAAPQVEEFIDRVSAT